MSCRSNYLALEINPKFIPNSHQDSVFNFKTSKLIIEIFSAKPV